MFSLLDFSYVTWDSSSHSENWFRFELLTECYDVYFYKCCFWQLKITIQKLLFFRNIFSVYHKLQFKKNVIYHFYKFDIVPFFHRRNKIFILPWIWICFRFFFDWTDRIDIEHSRTFFYHLHFVEKNKKKNQKNKKKNDS